MNDAHIGRDAVLMFSRSTDAFDPLARPLYQAHTLSLTMTSIGTGYDLSASTYSPDGRIFQVNPVAPAV
jgi:hypothetical protein